MKKQVSVLLKKVNMIHKTTSKIKLRLHSSEVALLIKMKNVLN